MGVEREMTMSSYISLLWTISYHEYHLESTMKMKNRIVKIRGTYRQAQQSSEQAGLHDLLEPDPLNFKILVVHPGGQIQHLTKTYVHTSQRALAA